MIQGVVLSNKPNRRELLESRPAHRKASKCRKSGHWYVGGVYIVEAVGLNRFKIGFSKSSLGNRLEGLKTACPVELLERAVIPGAPLSLERELHHRFRGQRLHGEWFSWSPDIEDLIQALNLGGEPLLKFKATLTFPAVAP